MANLQKYELSLPDGSQANTPQVDHSTRTEIPSNSNQDYVRINLRTTEGPILNRKTTMGSKVTSPFNTKSTTNSQRIIYNQAVNGQMQPPFPSNLPNAQQNQDGNSGINGQMQGLNTPDTNVAPNVPNAYNQNTNVQFNGKRTTLPAQPERPRMIGAQGATTTPLPLKVDLGYPEQIPPWMSQCMDIYIDLGSNVGVQVRKIFEPERYPQTHKRIVKLYNEEFGTSEMRKRKNSGLCAFGFEPNPKHYKKLRLIEKNYATKGWKVKFFPFAVSNKNATVTFWSETNSSYNDWGATLYKVKGEAQDRTINVTQIRLADFIKIHLPNKQIKAMKFDVEGAEYEILTDFHFEGLLCQNRIKIIIMKWHHYILETREWRKFYRTHQDLVNFINTQKCNVTDFRRIDHESHFYDVSLTW